MASSVVILDPSLIYRPEEEFRSNKAKGLFRNYAIDENDPIQERVRQTYLKMHTNQTVDFVRNKLAYWTRFDKAELTILEALDLLNGLVDESDPDVDIPNSVHAYQTAERIREVHPDKEWFQLTGLIHDVGKVLAVFGEEQWAVVGDTFPVGCAYQSSIVYRDTSFNKNPDLHNPKYNTKYGIYEPNCGLEKVLMSWGHDEYLYRVLRNHPQMRLPQEALYMIRFHSFYPWHTGNDYDFLCSKRDLEMKKWVNEFNKFDLYTKSDEAPDVEAIRPYYENLIEKYIPGKIKW